MSEQHLIGLIALACLGLIYLYGILSQSEHGCGGKWWRAHDFEVTSFKTGKFYDSGLPFYYTYCEDRKCKGCGKTKSWRDEL